jgi:hypothetical protein
MIKRVERLKNDLSHTIAIAILRCKQECLKSPVSWHSNNRRRPKKNSILTQYSPDENHHHLVCPKKPTWRHHKWTNSQTI